MNLSILDRHSVDHKLLNLKSSLFDILNHPNSFKVPEKPARDIPVTTPDQLGDRKGLSFKEGQARLLHDLASIELQAAELGARTLIEFPDAPEAFREELLNLTVSEGRHFQLCLQGLEKLGFKWGDWGVHVSLWKATAAEDSLLDRILIVHRYLEGSGLDAGSQIHKKLQGVAESPAHKIVETIVTEEVDHVLFGTRWYQNICKLEGLDPNQDYFTRMERLKKTLPRRVDRVDADLRRKSGFSEPEITYLENLRQDFLNHRI